MARVRSDRETLEGEDLVELEMPIILPLDPSKTTPQTKFSTFLLRCDFIDTTKASIQIGVKRINFTRQTPRSTFWVDMENSICHNGSKVVSTLKRHPLSKMPQSQCSPDRNPRDFWFFGS
jgi:hypothetical protein